MATTKTRTFITASQAARIAGFSPPAMSRRIKAGAIATYKDPSDYRVRLIDINELERYLEPTLIQQKEGPTAA
jgi:hypothetical protein